MSTYHVKYWSLWEEICFVGAITWSFRVIEGFLIDVTARLSNR